MKAAVYAKFGPPEVLQIKDVEDPIPKRNEVRIRIRATTVTGSDVLVRGFMLKGWMGVLGHLALGITGPRDPILGFILAGEVESVGRDVTRFKVGDAVFGTTIKSPSRPRPGTYAEYKCLPDDSVILPKPSNTTFEEAAAIPYGAAIGLHFLRKGGIRADQNVLIQGASGAVGTAAVQLARHFGARVTGVCSTGNVELVKSLGANAVIDYTTDDVAACKDRFDLVLDAVPAVKANRAALRERYRGVLSPNGRHVDIDDGRPDMGVSSLTFLKELVEAGKLRPVIDRVYPLQQIVEAHRYVETGHKRGNVIVTV
jgi:NADPH:quinone reductase-like Zn-dependent oxidoreductase